MIKMVNVLALVMVLGMASEGFAKRNNRGFWVPENNNKQQQNQNNQGGNYNNQAQPGDDTQIVNAMNNRKRTRFVEGKNLKVTQILPNDNSGNRHQKFVVELSNNQTIQIISNLDMCPEVPVKVGDEVAVGGEYIPTGRSGLVHWVHWDPRGTRPDGYIELNGQVYCKKN